MGKYNILFVIPSGRFVIYKLLKDNLKHLYGNDVSDDWAVHEAEALTFLHKPEYQYQLIVADLNIAINGDSVPNDQDHLGLDFIEKLDKDSKFQSIPKMLAVPRKEVKWYDAIQKIQLTKIISYENITALEAEFKDLAQAALEGKTNIESNLADKKPFGNVIIELDPGNTKGNEVLGNFAIETGDISFHPKEKFYFNETKLIDLINDSDDLIYYTDYGRWVYRLKKIGLALREEILSDKNIKFVQSFNQLKGRIMKDPDDIRNISIKFIIKREFHPILFEAFVEEESVEEESKFWMLHSPIYRGCYVNSSLSRVNPLFEKDDNTPLKCLIIQASTVGYVEGLKVKGKDCVLRSLPHLEKECSWLEKTFFAGLKQQGRIQEVLKIEKKEGEDFYDTVQKELEKGTWNMVHYAGHSISGEYNGDKGSFLFFPGEGEDKVIVDIDQISVHLRKLKFIYLSSCSSGGSGFVFNLAENYVPAIVGFRWDIEDSLALEITKTFYTHLFEKNSLETAFLETRRTMYTKNKESKIWAAPILIIQIPQC